MKYRAVVIGIHQENVLRSFLAARCVYGDKKYPKILIKGLRKLLRVIPNWEDEYYEYGGVQYVLLVQDGFIAASGKISRAMSYSSNYIEDVRYSLYQFDCVDIKSHSIPYRSQNEFVNWDPEDACIVYA